MINVFKENKELKKENTRLKKEISDDDYYHKSFLKREQYYINKIDDLQEKVKQLQKELIELYEKNYELAKKSTDDTTIKIKEFINKLEHNIKVDNDNNLKISGVTCDYVIDRLKDIIK